MRYRRPRLPFPLVAGAIGIGILSGKHIFGPPLEEYWSQVTAETEMEVLKPMKSETEHLGEIAPSLSGSEHVEFDQSTGHGSQHVE
eukprot:c19861_g1_i1 orf=217-474(-)